MLKNYGFRVVDLGKDVPKEDIVQAAIDEKADIIALSALMTTTMMRMKDVVELVKEKHLKTKVINRRCGYHTELCGRNRSRWIFERCGRCCETGAAVCSDFHYDKE